MKISCTSQYTVEPGQPMRAEDVYTWVGGVDMDATITALTQELGQRDPYTLFYGLKAEWEEER